MWIIREWVVLGFSSNNVPFVSVGTMENKLVEPLEIWVKKEKLNSEKYEVV